MTVPSLVLAPEAQDLLFRQARTANAFTDEPVSDETIRAVYDLVQWGPTSANGQPLRVVAVRSDEARARLLPHMSDGNRAKTAAAPLVLVFAFDSRFHEHMGRLFPHAPDARSWFEGSPEADTAREAGARMNGAMQAAYWIVGLRAAGLACGPMAGFDAAGVDAAFFPDGRFRSFLVMNVGRPAAEGAWFDRSPRHTFEDAVQTV